MVVLVELLTIPEAFVLHGLLQLTANGYRAWLNRAYILWGPTVHFLLGVAAILVALALFSFTPDRALVLIALGLVPFVASAVKNHWQPKSPKRVSLGLLAPSWVERIWLPVLPGPCWIFSFSKLG
mgnify:CR=1 FL=1